MPIARFKKKDEQGVIGDVPPVVKRPPPFHEFALAWLMADD